jgi:N-acylneuraminate cytidylyltransferase
MNNIAIITARGGSKRIPRKNIKPFLGIPIITYSIKAAIQSELFDEIMVSTDDDEIAEIALVNGAKVPFFRSHVNSNDYAGTAEVLCEVLNEYKLNNKIFTNGCCIYPTAPFVNSSILNRSYRKYLDGNYDVLNPIVKYSYPIQRSVFINEDDQIVMRWPENYHKRSQDLQLTYHDAGQFYWFKTESMLKNMKLITSNTGYIELNDIEVQDIDTIDDWNLAEIKYSIINGSIK